jgi:hypothetical protein
MVSRPLPSVLQGRRRIRQALFVVPCQEHSAILSRGPDASEDQWSAVTPHLSRLGPVERRGFIAEQVLHPFLDKCLAFL